MKLSIPAAAVLVLALVCSGARAETGAQVIIDWDQLAQQHIFGQPFSQVRQYAMVHVAMADAVVAIQGRYEPFHAATWAPSGASPEAAAAQAARDVLVHLIPGAAATFDARLAETLAAIPPGRRTSGVQVGKAVAEQVIAWRQQDGFSIANPQPSSFLASTLPGIWRATVAGPAQFSRLGDVTPFGVQSPTQFLPAPPPQLESDEYAADYNEVLQKGVATGSTRSPEETRTALVWALSGAFANVTTPFRLWHNVARDVSQTEGLALLETARLFALLSTSIHDSLQTAHASKFVYRLWRPETAIANADIDNNPATVAQAGWTPLLVTPPYPSHGSNMACIGAGAARMLANVFGSDAKPFQVTWYSASSEVVHSQPYDSFWAAAMDEGDSRVLGGIHFRFEIDASQMSCAAVADYIFANRMRPR
jgi:hypothetical protein